MPSPRRAKRPTDRAPIAAGPRVAIYHRVSTLDQDPTLARRDLEAWVNRHGGTVAMLVEESASGAWNARPGLVRVIEAARSGTVDTVLVWKLDRWGRSALDVLANIQALSNAGARFVALTQGLDVKPGGDAMSRLMLTVLAAVAEFERDLIRERTRLGIDRARAAGVTLGRPRAKGPSSAEVRKLRRAKRSWSEVASQLGCSVGTARRRAAESSRVA